MKLFRVICLLDIHSIRLLMCYFFPVLSLCDYFLMLGLYILLSCS
uniref:Uncharacterized protein n=1 Tax=Rhizophora mucronata TaxID=61149 RepID=A0A2P2QWN5_RHIMU